jgi:hypothetical protein
MWYAFPFLDFLKSQRKSTGRIIYFPPFIYNIVVIVVFKSIL